MALIPENRYPVCTGIYFIIKHCSSNFQVAPIYNQYLRDVFQNANRAVYVRYLTIREFDSKTTAVFFSDASTVKAMYNSSFIYRLQSHWISIGVRLSHTCQNIKFQHCR